MTVFDLDPSVVRPGWTPLIILILMAISLVFLYRSMRRQFRRIDVTRFQRDQETPETRVEERPPPAPQS
jgi:hypothetical protein